MNESICFELCYLEPSACQLQVGEYALGLRWITCCEESCEDRQYPVTSLPVISRTPHSLRVVA